MSKEELEQYFQSLEDIEALNDIFASIDKGDNMPVFNIQIIHIQLLNIFCQIIHQK